MPRLKRHRSLRKGKKAKHPEQKRRRWLRDQLIKRAGGACEYCGDQVTLVKNDSRMATIDHIVPISKGGTTVLPNLRLACSTCNAEKGDGVAVDVFVCDE